MKRFSLNLICAENLGSLHWLKVAIGEQKQLESIQLIMDSAVFDTENSAANFEAAISNKPMLRDFVCSMAHCRLGNIHAGLGGLLSTL